MDYEFKTTFWMDFTIADRFGLQAVKETFERAFEEWKDNVVYMTELTLVVNWKSWEKFDQGLEDFSEEYAEMYYKCKDYGYDHFTGDDLRYFWETLD